MAVGRPLQRREGTSFKIIDGEALVVLPHTGEYKILNGVGSLVWQLLDGSRDLESIISRVCEEFSIPADQARNDVEDFLRVLEQNQMLAGS
jgi:hypothetical protein